MYKNKTWTLVAGMTSGLLIFHLSFIFFFFALTWEGCASTPERNDHLQAHLLLGQKKAFKGFELKTLDLNRDGQPDQFFYSNPESKKIVYVERDLNFDGKVDLSERYDDRGRLKDEKMDFDLDGQIDGVLVYQGDKIKTKHYALGFRSSMSLVKIYDRGGALEKIERDLNGDGKADRWEYYHYESDKMPFKIEIDRNGDGQVDEVQHPEESQDRDEDHE